MTTDLRVQHLGKHRFEDMLMAEEVVQYAIGPDFGTSTFNLSGLDLYDHNLPVFFDTFVGRGPLIQKLVEVASTTRVVTLVGSGGVGKTRLAIHSAARLLLNGFDMARIVRLVGLTRGSDIGSSVAEQSGIRSAKLDDFIAAYKAKKCLLVIDNCEHVLSSAVMTVRRITDEMPFTTVIVTSRERLDIGGELAVEIPTLSLPPPDYDCNSARDYGAVELFVDRLVERASDFRIEPATVPVIVSICRKLDGLPLALEHAAGQAAYLGLVEVDVGLEKRFDLLKSERKDYDERHRTVWATIDWSYGLLSDEERQCLGNLSVFSGMFSMSDAIAVVSDDVVDISKAHTVVSSLIRKSLVVREFDSHGNCNFHLLESVREFAREKSLDRFEKLLERSFAHVRSLIYSAYDSSNGHDSAIKFSDLNLRYGIVYQALDWAVCTHHPDASETLRRMARYWMEYGPISDGVYLLEKCVAWSESVGEFSCDTANALAVMLWMSGSYDAAQKLFEKVLVKADASGDLLTGANALNNLAGLSMTMGISDVAEQHLRRAKDIYRQAGETVKSAICAANLGYNLARTGNPKESICVIQEVLEESKDALPFETKVVLLLNLSDSLRMDGRPFECLCTLSDVLEKCSLHEHASTVPKALLRCCVVLKENWCPKEVAHLYGMACQGFSEFSSKDFAERVEMKASVERFLVESLGVTEMEMHVASGTIIDSPRRTLSALKIVGNALDKLSH